MKYQWEREVRRFCDRSAVVIEGGRRERARLYDSDVFFKIVNYEAVVRDKHLLADRDFDLVVLDEAQRIKNWKTKTPLENRLEELFSIVQFLDNRVLGPMWEFEQRYLSRDAKGQLTGYQRLDEVRRRLAPLMLRRRKEDVLRELPGRVENNLYVGMTPQQLDPHESYRQHAHALRLHLDPRPGDALLHQARGVPPAPPRAGRGRAQGPRLLLLGADDPARGARAGPARNPLAPPPPTEKAPPPADLAVALSALAKGLQVETAGDRVRLQLELPRAQMESVRQTLVPVIRTLADALIGALGG